MTNKERYKQAFSTLHTSTEFSLEVNKMSNTSKKIKLRKLVVSATACMLIFVSSINLSPVLAANIENVPVLGQISKIFLLSTYIEQKDDYDIVVSQPAVDGKETINERIEEAIADYKIEAEKSILEYKDAYIATGGTEQGFQDKNIEVVVDYEIKADNDKYISFVLEMYENWIASSASYQYYNLNSQTGEVLSLYDILGDDYISIANTSIQNQIEQNPEKYISKENGGFESITDNTAFYINENGNPVIVFEKYEIADGASGRPEFEITLP